MSWSIYIKWQFMLMRLLAVGLIVGRYYERDILQTLLYENEKKSPRSKGPSRFKNFRLNTRFGVSFNGYHTIHYWDSGSSRGVQRISMPGMPSQDEQPNTIHEFAISLYIRQEYLMEASLEYSYIYLSWIEWLEKGLSIWKIFFETNPTMVNTHYVICSLLS